MLEKPVVIRNKLNKWKILSYEEKNWCDAFQGEKLRFRKGYKAFREEPYWEQHCEDVKISINDFFNISKTEENDFWLYFDYKYMKDVLPVDNEILKVINWADFGLYDLDGSDSTVWIGNEGAHTPCHMDTYGCNLVAQIVGRKLWILIPPSELDSMCPIRVPYEESSIYSSCNFYTPTFNLLRLKNCYKITLNPGELLFVPKHWWHYVENLELAISVNVWIPQESDHEDRMQEAIVRHYVSNICQGLTKNESMCLLNPNEHNLLICPFEDKTMKLFAANCKKFREENRTDNLEDFENFLNKYAIEISPFPESEIKKFIEDKIKRHNYDPSCPADKSENNENKCSLQKVLINSFCHPKVVETIKEYLLESL